MRLGGITTSLTDWEGRVSAVLWFAGCSFRCQYCQNPELLSMTSGREYTVDEIEEELIHSKRVIDSIVFCGGEPTIQSWPLSVTMMGLADSLELDTKLDTNGYRGWVVRTCIKHGLDKLSLDIKTAPEPEQYRLITGYDDPIGALDGIRTILNVFSQLPKGQVELEVRTTIVPGLNNDPEIIKAIVGWIQPFADEYSLQSFNNQKTYNPILRNVQPCSRDEMEALAEIAEPHIPKVNIRPRLL